MWTIFPSFFACVWCPRSYNFPSNRFLRKPRVRPLLLALILTSSLPLSGQGAGMTRRTTEATLSVASPDQALTALNDAKTLITVTASVRSGGAPVSPGSVLFCDADAPICQDGAILGRAQLRANGTAVLPLSPGIIARHPRLKAI